MITNIILFPLFLINSQSTIGVWGDDLDEHGATSRWRGEHGLRPQTRRPRYWWRVGWWFCSCSRIYIVYLVYYYDDYHYQCFTIIFILFVIWINVNSFRRFRLVYQCGRWRTSRVHCWTRPTLARHPPRTPLAVIATIIIIIISIVTPRRSQRRSSRDCSWA